MGLSGAAAFQLFINKALVRGVLVDYEEFVGKLGKIYVWYASPTTRKSGTDVFCSEEGTSSESCVSSVGG